MQNASKQLQSSKECGKKQSEETTKQRLKLTQNKHKQAL